MIGIKHKYEGAIKALMDDAYKRVSRHTSDLINDAQDAAAPPVYGSHHSDGDDEFMQSIEDAINDVIWEES